MFWNLRTACLGQFFGVQGFSMDAVKIDCSSLLDTVANIPSEGKCWPDWPGAQA
jgi:hypothetical protein